MGGCVLGPGGAAIGRAQQPGTESPACIAFTGTRIGDRRIARIEGERTDRQGLLIVRARVPRVTTVFGFPDAARGRTNQEVRRVAGIDRDRRDPAGDGESTAWTTSI